MPRRRTFRTLCIGVLAVFGLAICVVGSSIWRERGDAISNGVRDLDNLAGMFGGQLERAIQSVDIVLQDLRNRALETDDDAAPTDHQLDADRWRQFLVPTLRMIPQATEMAVVDAHGRLVVSTAFDSVPEVGVTNRNWFRGLAETPDDRLVVARRLGWQPAGRTLLVLARRLNGADGSFRGVIFAALGRGFVEGNFARLKARRDQVISIVRSGGDILIRYPDTGDHAGAVMPSWSPWYETVRQGGGTYRAPGPFDPDIRWVAVHPLSSAPLVVNTGVPEAILLEEWWSRALLTAGGTAALLVCALLLLAVMANQFRALSVSRYELAAKAGALERSEAELRLQNRRFDAALNNMSQGLAMFDGHGRVVVCNAPYRAMLELPPELAGSGHPLRDIIVHCHEQRGFPADVDAFMAKVAAFRTVGEANFEFRDVDDHLLAFHRELLPDGGWLVTIEDITSRRAGEEQISRLAHNDLLTGIPNRVRFREQIGLAQERLKSSGEPFTVMLLDLDRFKEVNDSLGHAAGDVLLKETARRLQSSLRSNDRLARLGGDEFAIVQSPSRNFKSGEDTALSMRENAIILGQRIIDLISDPYEIDGNHVFVGVSIGVAVAPADGDDPEVLMKKADRALYRSKSEGRNVCTLFTADMAEEADQRHRLEADLRASLDRGEFELYYQPQIEVRTGRVCGQEALVRWNHPERGLVAPGEFISLAEDTGLISELGDWVVHAACTEASRWPADVKVAVNISPVQFRNSNLFDVILCALIESGLPAERLEIEITERVLLEHDLDNLHVLHQLKSLGVSIALDDFGTGYSSLSYLTKFPFDKIKIDQSFTRGIMERGECEAVICAVIGLGRTLDMVTVAEGVETEDQLVALRAAGVDHVQGYLFGRPTPAADIRFDGPSAERPEAMRRLG